MFEVYARGDGLRADEKTGSLDHAKELFAYYITYLQKFRGSGIVALMDEREILRVSYALNGEVTEK